MFTILPDGSLIAAVPFTWLMPYGLKVDESLAIYKMAFPQANGVMEGDFIPEISSQWDLDSFLGCNQVVSEPTVLVVSLCLAKILISSARLRGRFGLITPTRNWWRSVAGEVSGLCQPRDATASREITIFRSQCGMCHDVSTFFPQWICTNFIGAQTSWLR